MKYLFLVLALFAAFALTAQDSIRVTLYADSTYIIENIYNDDDGIPTRVDVVRANGRTELSNYFVGIANQAFADFEQANRRYRDTERFSRLTLATVNAQKSEFTTKLLPYKFVTGFISGGSRGLREVISFHPDRFFERYPNANGYYWDNEVAWLNKYKNRDPSQGPACFGCTTFLAWTRDGLHFTGTLSNVSGVISLSLPLYEGPNQTIWQYLAEIGISSFGYWLGFHWMYTLWFP